MAQEFFERTGRPLRITDTFRTIDEQSDLKKRKPKLAAPPGYSKHEKGLAMDIHTEDVPDVERLGLLDKYGFHRPVLHKGETWHIELAPDTTGMVADVSGKTIPSGKKPTQSIYSLFEQLDKESAISKAIPPKSVDDLFAEIDSQTPTEPEQVHFDLSQAKNLVFPPAPPGWQQAMPGIGADVTGESRTLLNDGGLLYPLSLGK